MLGINSINPSVQGALKNVVESQATAIERLSSGKRINSAKDDAAGLAISERMTSQIRAMDVGRRNVSDGISALQTADGAMAEIANNLQRVRELAVQAANSVVSDSDRTTLQYETEMLIDEINRSTSATTFNGQTLLNGTFTGQPLSLGSTAADLSLTLPKLTDLALDESGFKTQTFTYGQEDNFSTADGAESSFFSTGYQAYAANSANGAVDPDDTSLQAIRGGSFDLQAVEGQIVGVTLSLRARPLDDNKGEGNDVIVLTGFDDSGSTLMSRYEIGLGWDSPPNNLFNFDWQIDDRPPHPAEGYEITLDLTNFSAKEGTGLSLLSEIQSNRLLDVVVGDDTIIDYVSLTVSSRTMVDLSSQSLASESILSVDYAIQRVSDGRSSIGAQLNRLDSAARSLEASNIQAKASRSRILDADFAEETAQLTKAQIMVQSATAMTVQANAQKGLVLQLLKDF